MRGKIFLISSFIILVYATKQGASYTPDGPQHTESKSLFKEITTILLNALTDIIKVILNRYRSEIPSQTGLELTETTTENPDWNLWTETTPESLNKIPEYSTDIWYWQNWCSYYEYVKGDSENNSTYYLCVNYRWQNMSCPFDKPFNASSLSCGDECITGLRKPRPDPKLDTDSKYLECNGTTWVEKTCPYGEFFELYSRRTCQLLTCWSSWKQPSPVDNTKYFQCKGHSFIEKSCPVGQIFNRYSSRCENDTCSPGDKKPGYDMWDTLYTDECGITRSCPGGGKYWYSINQCIGTKINVTVNTFNPEAGPYNASNTNCSCSGVDCANNTGDIYFECIEGSWTLKRCPSGHSYYESEIGTYCLKWDTCIYKARKELTSLIPDLPIVTLNGSFYYECFRNGWEVMACPSGETFDKGLLNCTKNPNTYTNQTHVCPEGSKKSNDENPNAYYLCDSNSWVAQECLGNETYSVGQCIYSPDPQDEYAVPIMFGSV